MMNFPNQSQIQMAKPQPDIGKSYVQTTVGILKVVTIILGTISVGLAYTELTDFPGYNRPTATTSRPQDLSTPTTSTKASSRRCSQPFELERFLLSTTAIALILSVASLYINSLENVTSTCPDVIFHMMVGPMLIIAGLISVGIGAYELDHFKDGHGCACPDTMRDCWYTYQISAGIITFLNGILYTVLGFYMKMLNKKSSAKTGPSFVSPSQAQVMPMQNIPPGTTPSQQNVPGLIPLQQPQQQPNQNVQQSGPGPTAPVQQNVEVAQPPPNPA